ncbi:MAG: sugar isomerase domain-containing protein [Bryobacteraceae bacterium]|jgi:uncharacterized phosphosugar-binding protein|nr:sugar isomerase domain-containing protein [Bryobacteraceae bacterium]
MSAERYLNSIEAVIAQIRTSQLEKIRLAAEKMAQAIATGRRVYLFGSGHSVLPVMDVFPRYGSFVGFFPLYDPRLMWFSVVGPGGARELLWLERQPGYARVFLESYSLEPGDCMVVFSHGGRNAAPVEAAEEARRRGLSVIAVTSLSSSACTLPRLAELADIAIDNCVPAEDALVDVGWPEKIAAGSTVGAVAVAMSLVAEVGARLAARGLHPPTFVSPNTPGVEPDHNARVFQEYARLWYRRSPDVAERT